MTTKLQRLSIQVASKLAATGRVVVFAESCTAGMVAASLAKVPGISQHLAGSMVVYQCATKNVWLEIPKTTLVRPGPVSRTVAKQMSEQVLKHTAHADLSASVTGHLGPDAPPKLDGVIFVAVSVRSRIRNQIDTEICQHLLKNVSRQARQREATQIVLTAILQKLK